MAISHTRRGANVDFVADILHQTPGPRTQRGIRGKAPQESMRIHENAHGSLPAIQFFAWKRIKEFGSHHELALQDSQFALALLRAIGTSRTTGSAPR